MERKQKTYEATNAIQLDTYCLVDGKKFLVEFRGGTLDPRKHGRFNTSDPKVIKAMDDDIVRVGPERASYKCVHTETLIDDEAEIEVEPIPEKIIPGIKTVTKAREWLIEASDQGIIKKGITSSMIKNRTDVLRFAGENKVTFTDLPTES